MNMPKEVMNAVFKELADKKCHLFHEQRIDQLRYRMAIDREYFDKYIPSDLIRGVTSFLEKEKSPKIYTEKIVPENPNEPIRYRAEMVVFSREEFESIANQIYSAGFHNGERGFFRPHYLGTFIGGNGDESGRA